MRFAICSPHEPLKRQRYGTAGASARSGRMEDGRRAHDGRATVVPGNIVSRDRRGIRRLALKGRRVETNRRAPRAFAAAREQMIEREGDTHRKTTNCGEVSRSTLVRTTGTCVSFSQRSSNSRKCWVARLRRIRRRKAQTRTKPGQGDKGDIALRNSWEPGGPVTSSTIGIPAGSTVSLNRRNRQQ